MGDLGGECLEIVPHLLKNKTKHNNKKPTQRVPVCLLRPDVCVGCLSVCVVTTFSLGPTPSTLHSQPRFVMDGVSWLLSKALRPPGAPGLEGGGVRVDNRVFYVPSLCPAHERNRL